ncbi:MAG: phage portal protein, partial [Phascolarctobacterium sp.]|nr:phage portal protein [Phascolarctobacterium sp.]
DGTDLGEFRRNLSTYRAVKIKTVDGADGGVDELKVEVNAANYETVLKLLKKAIVENAMGYDAKDDRIGGNANTMNIRSMYSDIDLDANDMETEYQAAFVQLLELVNAYLQSTGNKDYSGTHVTITFNRDMIFNDTEIINNLASLGVKVSNETLVGQLPFIDDVQKELDRIKAEQAENIELYGGAFDMNQMQGMNDKQDEKQEE